MVPSDSVNNATPTGMHGMSLAIKTTERYLLCSPLLLLKNRGLTLQSPSASRSQSELAARNGFLLTLNDCPLPSHHLGFERFQPASSLFR
jgi:hypothetical protein